MNIGIIGASFAKAAFLPALRHVADAKVTAVASARLSSAKEAADAFNISNAYDDWEQMLKEHSFDLVCIATPTVTHAPMTLAALESGAHVLCEKPTAMNADEAKTMLEKAEALGRVHMIDHELRFNPNRRKIKELIERGDLGEIRHVNIANITPTWGDHASRPKDDWWSLESQGGGRLGANGSHQVDLLRWWLGEVKSVSGQALTLVPERKDKKTGEPWTATADDTTHFTLEFKNGALASVFLSGVARHNMDNHTQIFGSEGSLLLSNGNEKLLFGKPGGDFEDISVTDPNANLEGVNAGIWNVSVVSLMRELCGAIAKKRPLKEGATFVDGWRNQQVLDGVKRSGKERRWIDLDA
jgi:predicted dehydrogenase